MCSTHDQSIRMGVAVTSWVRTQYGQGHSLFAQLTDSSGPFNIQPNTTVVLSGKLIGETTPSIGGNAVVVRAGAEADDPSRGFVRYDLSTADMAVPGIFYCQWVLTPGGSSQSQPFPEDGYDTLLILPSV